jgi:hypothetical protein
MELSHAAVIKSVMQATNFDMLMFFNQQVMPLVSELAEELEADSVSAVEVSFDMLALLVDFEKHYVYLIEESSDRNNIKAYKLAKKDTDRKLLINEPKVYFDEMVPAEKIIYGFDAKSYADFIRSL